ncbi:MAG: hypothetical protein ACYTDT_00245 [Planctomycetota bacterium]|jgi:hypothetical protein
MRESVGGVFVKFADTRWWIRWLINLPAVVLGLLTNYWILGVGFVLTVINIYVTMQEVLDRFMPRRGHDA